MASVSTKSQAAVSRPDLHAVGAPYMEKYGLGDKSVWTILKSAAKLQVQGAQTLYFPEESLLIEDANESDYGVRAPNGQFRRGVAGNEYGVETRPVDRGKTMDLDESDDYIQSQIRSGGSLAEQEAKKTKLSLIRFFQLIERAGVIGGLGNATTPFAQADQSLSGTPWNGSTTSIFSQFEAARAAVPWLDLQALYCGRSAFAAIRRAPELTSMFGGMAAIGQLSAEMLMEVLELKYLYVGRTAYYGEYATLCAQGEPGSDPMADEASAVVYTYNPQSEGEGEYGIQYTEEPVPMTANKVRVFLAHANSDVVFNPLAGVRMSAVLTA